MPRLEGWLEKMGEKRGATLRHKWRRRYFAVEAGNGVPGRGARLYYYERKGEINEKGSIDLSTVMEVAPCSVVDPRADDTEFSITVPGRVYKLRAPTPEEATNWIRGLRSYMGKGQGHVFTAARTERKSFDMGSTSDGGGSDAAAFGSRATSYAPYSPSKYDDDMSSFGASGGGASKPSYEDSGAGARDYLAPDGGSTYGDRDATGQKSPYGSYSESSATVYGGGAGSDSTSYGGDSSYSGSESVRGTSGAANGYNGGSGSYDSGDVTSSSQYGSSYGHTRSGSGARGDASSSYGHGRSNSTSKYDSYAPSSPSGAEYGRSSVARGESGNGAEWGSTSPEGADMGEWSEGGTFNGRLNGGIDAQREAQRRKEEEEAERRRKEDEQRKRQEEEEEEERQRERERQARARARLERRDSGGFGSGPTAGMLTRGQGMKLKREIELLRTQIQDKERMLHETEMASRDLKRELALAKKEITLLNEEIKEVSQPDFDRKRREAELEVVRSQLRTEMQAHEATRRLNDEMREEIDKLKRALESYYEGEPPQQHGGGATGQSWTTPGHEVTQLTLSDLDDSVGGGGGGGGGGGLMVPSYSGGGGGGQGAAARSMPSVSAGWRSEQPTSSFGAPQQSAATAARHHSISDFSLAELTDGSEGGPPVAPWVPDEERDNCFQCQAEFGFFTRRHHCRKCGQIFCDECSSLTAPVVGYDGRVRVCDNCYIEVFPNGEEEDEEEQQGGIARSNSSLW